MTGTTRRISLLLPFLPFTFLLPGCAGTTRPEEAGRDANLAPAVAAVTAAPRASIEHLLQGMSRAIEAADQPAYLATVSQNDPVFALEQKNWARDLARKPVARCEVRLADPEADMGIAPGGVVILPVTFTWQMPDAKERTLTFPARFVRSGKGYLYAGEHWKTLEAPGVRVFFEEGAEEAAKAVAEVLPAVREEVHRVFGLENEAAITTRTQEVKLYRTVKHLQHSIYLSYTDGLAGWNEPGESIKILSGRTAAKGMMRTLLAHEYGHVATFELGPQANEMPWWILEGVAEFSAEKYSRARERAGRTVRGWSASGKLVPWDDLADFHGEALKHQQQVYTQGHHMVIYITERFGDRKRNEWLRSMSNGATLDAATRAILGESFAELDRKWRASLETPRKTEPDPSES
jgi:hypothetical protein